MGRPNWYYEHWPSCTCVECEAKRRYRQGYYQERNTWHTVLTVVIILFILGIVVALAFVGVEPLASIKNTIAGTATTPAPVKDANKITTAPTPEPPASSAPPITEIKPVPSPTPQVEPPQTPPPQTSNPPGVPITETPSPINVPELEKQIHQLVNVERTKNGLAAVAWDDAVSAVARKHSEDMAKRNYFNHISPEGQNSVDRCRLAGVNISKYPAGTVYYLGCSENIFMCSLAKVYWYNRSGTLVRTEYYTPTEIAELAVNGWMGSQGHRENILKSYWRTEGIGIAVSTGGDVYVTQNFN